MSEPRIGREGLQTIADARMRRDDHGNLRGEADGLAQRRRAGIVGDFGIEGRERRNGGSQHVHRVGALHGADHDLLDESRSPRTAECCAEITTLLERV